MPNADLPQSTSSQPRKFRAELGGRTFEGIEQLVIIGSWPNSSFSYYLDPQLAGLPARSVSLFNRYLLPHKIPTDAPEHFARNAKAGPLNKRSLVIINRYVKASMLRWAEVNQAHVAGLVYFVDDDLAAMAKDRSIPLIKKQQPLKTIARWRKIMAAADCVVASTDTLADRITHRNKIVLSPVLANIPAKTDTSDPFHAAYLAKMHNPEHAFLLPIVGQAMQHQPRMRFSVIAEGAAERAWQKLARQVGRDRLHIVPPQSLENYFKLLQSLDAGICLAPLLVTKLNAARSCTKRYDAVRLGAAGLFADMPAYTAHGRNSGEIYLPPVKSKWVEALNALMTDRTAWESARDASRTLAQNTLDGSPRFFAPED